MPRQRRTHLRWPSLVTVGFTLACTEAPPPRFAPDANVVAPAMDATPGPEDSGVVAPAMDASTPQGLLSVRLEPSFAQIDASGGQMPRRQFQIIPEFADGQTRRLGDPEFTLEPNAVGSITPNGGLFVANGIIGGRATVRVEVGLLGSAETVTATATVIIKVEHVDYHGMATQEDVDRFTGSLTDDPVRAARVVYPLDGVVMPQNSFPAHIQWSRSAPGDLFRVRMTKPNAVVTFYTQHGADFRKALLPDARSWRAIAQTDPEEPAILTVDRYIADARTTIASSERVELRFARAALTGSIYFWSAGFGRIFRVDDGTDAPINFLPNPPAGVPDAQGNNEVCIGCHAVSNNGRWMAGRLGGINDSIGAVFDLTTDLTGDPPPTTFPLDNEPPTSLRWWFASWSGDDTRLVVSTDEENTKQLKIYDPFLGTEITSMGQLPANATQPAWSPDSRHIAYISGPNGFGGEYTGGDVSIVSVGTASVSTPRVIHRAASLSGSVPPGDTDSSPTWSPDSQMIVFANGTAAASKMGSAALYAMRPDGSGLVRLSKASGGVNGTTSFLPNYSPFTSGGFHWVAFLSTREYGNELVGTAGQRIQQVWIAAIDPNAPDGQDPSQVAYWMPGQPVETPNVSAFWAPRPCRDAGAECSVGAECCSGDCRPDANQDLVCSPPPPDRCRSLNQTCSATTDCCAGLICLENVCILPPL